MAGIVGLWFTGGTGLCVDMFVGPDTWSEATRLFDSAVLKSRGQDFVSDFAQRRLGSDWMTDIAGESDRDQGLSKLVEAQEKEPEPAGLEAKTLVKNGEEDCRRLCSVKGSRA